MTILEMYSVEVCVNSAFNLLKNLELKNFENKFWSSHLKNLEGVAPGTAPEASSKGICSSRLGLLCT